MCVKENERSAHRTYMKITNKYDEETSSWIYLCFSVLICRFRATISCANDPRNIVWQMISISLLLEITTPRNYLSISFFTCVALLLSQCLLRNSMVTYKWRVHRMVTNIFVYIHLCVEVWIWMVREKKKRLCLYWKPTSTAKEKGIDRKMANFKL